ncbi:hypothetical protein B0H10DRAFT_1809837, partial [Mycena sp. CBHHK59/15]
GDSMGCSRSAYILPAFRWVLNGLEWAGYTPVNHVCNGSVDRQGSQFGSCSIASLNFVAVSQVPEGPFWTDKSSALLRNKALQDLLIYHLLALAKETVFEDWTVPCALAPAVVGEVCDDTRPVGYNDFNLHRPMVSTTIKVLPVLLSHSAHQVHHPIHSFCENTRSQPLIDLPNTSARSDGIVKVSQTALKLCSYSQQCSRV